MLGRMLSVWPDLFYLWMAGPFILRLALGISLFSLYYSARRNIRGIFGLLAAVLLIIGLFTQPAALVSALLLLEEIWSKRHDRITLLPLLAIALALLVLGPGLFAFDWPL